MKSDAVLFGSSNSPRRWDPFSNFGICSFCWVGRLWTHSEGAFQWAKDRDNAAHLERCQRSPAAAKRSGRRVRVLLPRDWDNQRYGVMVSILEAKFSQNLPLKELLLSTGDAQIHEDRPDPNWGGGPNYPHGLDLLGLALMEVRNSLNRNREASWEVYDAYRAHTPGS